MVLKWRIIMSHLFFADDTILFAKACISKVKIKEILEKYQLASSQQFNLQKTTISFSPNSLLICRLVSITFF